MSSVGPATTLSLDVVTTTAERPRASSPSDAAQQFEALLIGFMLKSSREEGSSSWLGSGEDAAGASAIGYAEEQLARALSSKGGLGLAKMITANLEAQSRAYSKEPTSSPDGAAVANEPVAIP